MWETYPHYLPTLCSWTLAAIGHLALLVGFAHLSVSTVPPPKVSTLRVREMTLQTPSARKSPQMTTAAHLQKPPSALANSSVRQSKAFATTAPTSEEPPKTHPSPTTRKGKARKKALSQVKKVPASARKAPNQQFQDALTHRKRAGNQALASLAQMGNAAPARPSAPSDGKAQNDKSFDQKLIAHLQRMLELPECGNVCIEICISAEGRYVSHRVVSAESRVNQSYLEAALPHLTFPKPERETRALQTLTIDFSYRS